MATARSATVPTLVVRHPLWAFYLLSVALSWTVVLVARVVGADRMYVLSVASPAVAALVVTRLVEGPGAEWRFTRGALRWRVPLTWWAVAVLLPLAIVVGAVAAWSMRTGGHAWAFSLGPWLAAVPMILVLIPVNGITEELGWRGFWLARLQQRRPALAASVLVGLGWGLWHAPALIVEGTSQQIVASVVGFWPALLFWVAASVPISVVYTWLFNNAAHSVLVVSVLHAATNGWLGAAVTDLPPAGVAQVAAWFALGWTLAAAALWALRGSPVRTQA